MTKFREMEIYKRVIWLGIPIALENLVNSSINFIDNFMVGQENAALGLGTNAVAALGVSNQIFFIFIVSLFGLFSGAAVLSSQYFGNKDYDKLNNILVVLCTLGLLISIPVVIIGRFFPASVLSLYTQDPEVLRQGIRYFSISSLSFPLTAISFAFSMQLRVMGKSKMPFYSSLLGLVLNACGNFLLIPYFGVQGAAIATLIARAISLIFIIYLYNKHSYSEVKIINKDMFKIEAKLIKDILKISAPTFIHEIFWVVGTSIKTSIFSNIGAVEFAAVTVTATIASLLFSVFSGISNSSAILIGNEIGANDMKKAINVSKASLRLMLIASIMVAVILNILAPVLLSIMNLSPSLEALTRQLIVIESLLLIFKGTNLLTTVGILRAGGDVTYAMILDIIGTWFILIPVTYFSKQLGLEIQYIYAAGVASEIFLLAATLSRYKSRKWINRIID